MMKAIQITLKIAHPRMGAFQTNMRAIQMKRRQYKRHIMDDDKISIKNGSTEDPRVTLNDINIIKEMNTTQINNNDTNEEAIENNRECTTVANNNR